MKKWRVWLIAFTVAVVAVGMALAQGAGDRPRAERRALKGELNGQAGGAGQVAKILDELELTDEQKQKIEKIRADFETRIKEMAEKMRASMEEIRKFREDNPNDQEGLQKKRQEAMGQMTPLREAIQGFVEQVKAQLNEEQLKKFDQLLAERGGALGMGMGGGMGQGMGGRMGMQGGMGLPGTDPKLQEELQLTDQQKEKMKGLVQAYQEEQRQLLEKYTGLIKAMLTPEQQEKFEKAVAEMKNRPGNRMGMGPRGQRPGRPGPADNPPPPPDGGAPEEKPAD